MRWALENGFLQWRKTYLVFQSCSSNWNNNSYLSVNLLPPAVSIRKRFPSMEENLLNLTIFFGVCFFFLHWRELFSNNSYSQAQIGQQVKSTLSWSPAFNCHLFMRPVGVWSSAVDWYLLNWNNLSWTATCLIQPAISGPYVNCVHVKGRFECPVHVLLTTRQVYFLLIEIEIHVLYLTSNFETFPTTDHHPADAL
jgi:hypothetical protein